MNVPLCPKCQSEEAIPILYGYPNETAIQAAKEGKIKLGGCCVTGYDPRFYCKQCHQEFDPEAIPAEALREAIQGCLFGLACGDALGAAVEELRASDIRRHFPHSLREFERGVPGSLLADLPAGTYTDDTVMALGLVEAYIEREGAFDLQAIANNWIHWKKSGPYWELGPGTACNEALDKLIGGQSPRESGVDSAGNGGTMRVAPVGLVRWRNLQRCTQEAIEQSRITHAHPEADAAAACMALAISFLVRHHRQPFETKAFWDSFLPVAERISARFTTALRNAMVAEELPENVSGYVTKTLPAAFQIFLAHREDPKAAIVVAANAGGDTDSLAAMVGALAGAYQGAKDLPKCWVKGLRKKERILRAAKALWHLEDRVNTVS